MNNLYVFDLDMPVALEILSQFETSIESGEWIYFNQRENSIEALFKSSVKQSATSPSVGIISSLNDAFLDHFLGRFSVELEDNVAILKEPSFYDFCNELNTLLNANKKIFDLSRTEKWIWTESEKEKVLSPKLKDFIS